MMDHRRNHFKGYARLRIQHLDFDPSRHIYDKKVDDLIAQFETVGCHNDDILHAVPVLISNDLLDDALRTAGLVQSSLYNLANGCTLLNLREHTRLKCIYGRHRIRAAQRHFCEVERLWVVKFYDADMPADLIVDLEQEDLKFPNGRTLMYILDQDNQEVTDGWLRRTGQDHIEKCTRIKNYDGGRLKPVLQRLLHLKSLCCGMESIGSWDPIYAMHCYEVQEIYAYLTTITDMWTYILGPELDPELLDESTVLALQLLNPAELSQDCKTIESLFSRHQVFRLVKNPTTRAALEQRVLTCRRIVSLESFFADFKLLRACFDGMKLLLPRERRKKSRKHGRVKGSNERSFRKRFEFNFGGQGQADFETCYEDLWLWAMSLFPYFDSKFSRPLQHTVSDNRQPRFSSCSDSKKAQLAYKAHELWFRTEEISHLMATSQREDLHQTPISGGLDRPLQRRERMGRPTADNFKQNKRYLERQHVFNRLGSAGNERYPITFLFWRDIAQCCWRTEARWVLAPAYHESNNASNYNDRRVRARDEGQRKRQTRRFMREHDIEAELTKQRAMARDAQNRISEPRARRLAEGVGTSVLTPRAQETCKRSVSDLQDSIERYLREVPETILRDSQFSGNDDVKMEDQHQDHVAGNHLRPRSSSVENLERKHEGEPFRIQSEEPYDGGYHLPKHEDDRDETKFSVDPLEPKAKRSIDNFGKDAERHMDSEQEIFEDDEDDNKEDDYLPSGAHDDRTLVSRTSSVYSAQEDSTTETRPVESLTLARVAALEAKDESLTDYGDQNLELRESDRDEAATQEIVRVSRRSPQPFKQENTAVRTVETPMILIKPASFDSARVHGLRMFTEQSGEELLKSKNSEASGSTLLSPNPDRPMTQLFLSSKFRPIGNSSEGKQAIVRETRTEPRDRVSSVAHEDDKSTKEQFKSAESKQKAYVPLARSGTNLSSVEHETENETQTGHTLLHQHADSPNAGGASSSNSGHRLTQIALEKGIAPLGPEMTKRKRKRMENGGFKFKPRRTEKD